MGAVHQTVCGWGVLILRARFAAYSELRLSGGTGWSNVEKAITHASCAVP